MGSQASQAQSKCKDCFSLRFCLVSDLRPALGSWVACVLWPWRAWGAGPLGPALGSCGLGPWVLGPWVSGAGPLGWGPGFWGPGSLGPALEPKT